jgi:hypothetical protein
VKYWKLTYTLTTWYGSTTWERFVLSTSQPQADRQQAWERQFNRNAVISDFQAEEFTPQPYVDYSDHIVESRSLLSPTYA